MIGVLVVTHGQFGKECVSSLSLIAGEHEKVVSFGLNPADSVLELTEKVKSALAELDDGDGVLALVDLFGGSPFNVVASQLRYERLECVTGLNMNMLMTALEERDTSSLQELAEIAVQSGAAGIMNVRKQIRKVEDDDDV